MKILFLPLDERPCNYSYAPMIARKNERLDLILPDKEILSHKKQPADIEAIKKFLLDNVEQADVAVLSMDMLIYGGLLPSRLHEKSFEDLSKNIEILQDLKKKNPKVKIYAFQSLMRCPQYNSSEEEPDYYADYGYKIFKQKYLEDKSQRDDISAAEEAELSSIQIPAEILNDYVQRRRTNLKVNETILSDVKKGLIEFLIIPQDDSSPYGYTALDQQKLINQIQKENLQEKTMIFPGADEIGMTLINRAYNDFYHVQPKVFAIYSSILGPTIIPLYEDRPLYSTLADHLVATNSLLVDSPEEADYILAINTPGKKMQESFAEKKDITYSTFRNLRLFCKKIQYYLDKGVKVAVADSAYANGGDYALINYLDSMNLLDRLAGYAGWNTDANTLGTVIAQAEIGENKDIDNLKARIIEDVFYQANVRQNVVNNFLPQHSLSYYDFKDKEDLVKQEIANELLAKYNNLQLAKKYPIDHLQISMPWHRMFEIKVSI